MSSLNKDYFGRYSSYLSHDERGLEPSDSCVAVTACSRTLCHLRHALSVDPRTVGFNRSPRHHVEVFTAW